MADGSIVLVEIARGTLTRVWNGRTEVIADLGGGPNGAALGPDGAVYVCNNGGFEWRVVNGLRVPGRAAADYTTGRIERVDLATGRFERLYESFDGERLGGPNDIVFDRSGGFWFTDLGKSFARQRDHSGLYYARPDGSHLHRAVYPAISFNGVGLSPDERRRLLQRHATRRSSGRSTSPSPASWRRSSRSGSAAASSARCPAISCSTVSRWKRTATSARRRSSTAASPIFAPDGSFEHVAFPDPMTTNICFGGADMRDAYITLSGTGKLVKARWPRPGCSLNFSA